ncbi:hypothetical protein D3C76_153160 [compost metagenome]
MCTSEDIHPIIAGEYGQKGTTKSTKRMIFSNDLKGFTIKEFQENYSEGNTEFGIPLSEDINLYPFQQLTVLDTQGLNDWKSENEREETNKAILDVCDEADIILVTIPEGGSVVSTNVVLEQVFDRFCHKPIVFIYRAQQTREEKLKKEKAIPRIMPFVESNIQRYSEIYPDLGRIIKNAKLPEDAGVSPLFCILPNSEELSSDLDAGERLSDNKVLRRYISNALQYSINLQSLLIEEMANNYVEQNLDIVTKTTRELLRVENVVPFIKNVYSEPLQRPYVERNDYPYRDNVEYSWQGGSRGRYCERGGHYTYVSSNIYSNLKKIIKKLVTSVPLRSSLLSVLDTKSEDMLTPGTLNLQYYSYTRGVPVEWIINIRTELYKNSPNLFRDVTSGDFEGRQEFDYLMKTEKHFRDSHDDWNKYMEKFYFREEEEQNVIKDQFDKEEWNATVLIYLLFSVIHRIDFTQNLNGKIKSDFDNIAFNSQGKCVLWSENDSIVHR